MATPVLMPKQGQSVEECIITEWYKKVGDAVKKGEVLFAYETDKASFEENAPEDGILLKIFYNEGDEVPVLNHVAVIGSEDEDISGFGSQSSTDEADKDPGTKDVEPLRAQQKPESVPEDIPEQSPSQDTEKFISPRARNLAKKLNININQTQGSGPKGRIIERDVELAALEQPRMTKLAGRLSEEQPEQENITASGIGGRITSEDQASNVVYDQDYEDKPLTNIRKVIAKAMHASLQNSAQLTHHMSADARKIMDARKKVKEKQKEGASPNITLNDMICYSTIRALKQHPLANAHLLNGEVSREFRKVHLGFAVDTPRGLMVPCLKNADDLSLEGLSNQLASLAEKCRSGSIDPDLLSSQAASFTISNLGNYGVEMFTPVINLPQVGILGVNTIVNRPADLGNGVFGFIPHVGLSLTYDHRALDGGPATLLLREIKNEIEDFDY